MGILSQARSNRRWLAGLMLLGISLLPSTTSWACSVPVFRYALEHWKSDPYQVIFYHKGALPADQQKWLDQLSRDGKAGDLSANVDVIAVDLEKADPDDPNFKVDLELWEKQPADKSLPWMVVQYPLSFPNATTIWSGSPGEKPIDQLLQSAKRKEISRRILAGDTAVWLLLESGNKEADDLAEQRLRMELKRCETELQLPAADPQDVADGLISVEQASLKIQFSILRMSKTDLEEQLFVNMLLNSESDLLDEEYANEPMAFPIFGRGRALYAIIGKGIERSVIFDACQFLVGPCSCQVKRQNPGTDLLMAVDWQAAVKPQIPVDTSLPPLPVMTPVTGSQESVETTDISTTSPKDDAPQPTDDETDSMAATSSDDAEVSPKSMAESMAMSITVIGLAGAVVLVVVVGFLMKPSS